MKLFLPRTYDLDVLARANLHTHTSFSSCALEEMTPEAMVARGRELGLSRLAFTDHFHHDTGDENYLDYVSRIRERTRGLGGDMELIFGAELSAVGIGARLEKPGTNAALDLRLYSTNHFHCGYWHQPQEKTPRGYALFMLDITRELALSGMADCIAHPFIGGYVNCVEDRRQVSAAITDAELGDVLTLLRDCGVAYEINYRAVLGFPEFSRRFWGLGKEVGVTFTVGTDAHSLADMDTVTPLPDVRRVLGQPK